MARATSLKRLKSSQPVPLETLAVVLQESEGKT